MAIGRAGRATAAAAPTRISPELVGGLNALHQELYWFFPKGPHAGQILPIAAGGLSAADKTATGAQAMDKTDAYAFTMPSAPSAMAGLTYQNHIIGSAGFKPVRTAGATNVTKAQITPDKLLGVGIDVDTTIAAPTLTFSVASPGTGTITMTAPRKTGGPALASVSLPVPTSATANALATLMASTITTAWSVPGGITAAAAGAKVTMTLTTPVTALGGLDFTAVETATAALEGAAPAAAEPPPADAECGPAESAA